VSTSRLVAVGRVVPQLARQIRMEYHDANRYAPSRGTMSEELDQGYRRIVNAWCMYDWGSSTFSTTVQAAVLPVYFHQVVAASLVGNTASIYWGYVNAVALLLTALLAPILARFAKYTGGKK
jgi:MFS-type transporter involved in bile tolerance (Atg22 family)